jgi:hypothetical protein
VGAPLSRRKGGGGRGDGGEGPDLAEGGKTPGLLLEFGDESERTPLERLLDLLQDLLISDPVDDQLLDFQSGFVEGGQGVPGLGDGEGFREQDPGEGRPLAEMVCEVPALLFDRGDQLVGPVRVVDASEALGQDAVLLLQPVEGSGETLEEGRNLEEPQGMGGRCGIHDHLLHVALPGDPGQLQHAHQLVDAGQRKTEEPVHVLFIQIGPAPGDLLEDLPALAEPAVQGPLDVQLGREEVLRDLDRFPGQRPVEGVAERVGGVGGDGEDTAPPGRFQGGGGGAGGLADSPLAAEEAEGGESYGSSSSYV